MKLISICILLLAVSAWSNIFSIDAGISFEKGYLDIDTTKTCNVDTSYINCSLEKGLAYYSTLDTAVAVFFMPRIAKASVYALQSNPNTRSLTEILRYEFIKWVEWGIIVMTKDSAQRLLDRILPDSLQMNNRHILHKKVCDTDPSQQILRSVLIGDRMEAVWVAEFPMRRLPASLKKRFLQNRRNLPRQTRRLRRGILREQSRILPRSLCGFLNRRIL